MASLSKGYTFGATETVTNAKLHALVDSATISGIVNADIAVGAAIDFSKIAQTNIDGSKLTGLANIVSGAGVIPVANIPVSSIVPSGVIVMWSGTVATVPSGWNLCDGNNSTPDLRDKFIVGAKQDDGGVAKTNVSGSLTQSGGEATHTLITAEMPAHTHISKVGYVNTGIAGHAYTNPATYGETTTSAGGNGAHNNLPPYYALAYIMKS